MSLVVVTAGLAAATTDPAAEGVVLKCAYI